MINHLHTLICGRVLLDNSTGLSTYLDIIEGITLKKSKLIKIPPFSLVSRFWIKDGLENNETLELNISRKIDGKTKEVAIQTIPLKLESKGSNILVDCKIENLVLETPGLWTFDVKWRIQGNSKWKKIDSIPFKVNIIENELLTDSK